MLIVNLIDGHDLFVIRKTSLLQTMTMCIIRELFTSDFPFLLNIN